MNPQRVNETVNSAIFAKMADRLAQVFNDSAMLSDYENAGHLSESFGWDGRGLSPVSRVAFVATYGAATVLAAEKEARRRIAANDMQYSESQHARAMKEAQAAEVGHAAPAAGSYVLAVHSGLKCDDGRGIFGEIATASTYCADDMKDKAPQLCKVVEVYEVSAEEFARPSLADELVSKAREDGREFAGGAWIADEDAERVDMFNRYRYYMTLAAAVVCRDSGRWFLINSEGYSYARYCLMPTNWREMFADEVADEIRRDEERKAEAARIEAEEKAARYEEYQRKCAKYSGIMEDVKPYEDAEKEAQRKQYEEAGEHGYRSQEYKAAQKVTRAASAALMAARKRNLVAMAAHVFPGIKAKAVKSSKYYGGFDLVYFDGPRLEEFNAATDFDLFVEGWTCSDYSDGTEFHNVEFSDFAEKYMSMGYYDIDTQREWSKETRARLLSAVCEAVPGAEAFGYDNRHAWTAEELRKVAAVSGANVSNLLDQLETRAKYYNYIDAELVARWCFDCMDFDVTAPSDDPNKGTKKAAQPEETATDEDAAPADGLELVEIPEGVAVVGDSRTTYRNRKAIKAHGCKWNKDAQQWQATDAETVEKLREWFGVAHNEQPAEPEHGDTLAEIHEEEREFADNTRVIVTSLQAVGTVHEYKNGKYLVIFDDGKGTGNSWHNPEELATIPEWIKDGAKVYNVKRWRTGEPFTISDAAATVPTLTTADGFKFMCNVLDIVNNYTPHAPEAAHAPETVATEGQPAEVESAAQNKPEEFKTVEFYEREATDEHGRRIKKASEIKEQAARIECNYIAGRDGLRGIARRLERTKGAQHPDTVRAYERLQRRAAWLRRAELSAHAEAGRKRRAAYLRETTAEGNTLPAGEFGDLCYDYFGKSSVIVFGNTEDHAKQLEEIGGKKSDRIRYSPLQNGRKWTEKSGRTSGYYFTTEKAKAKAVEYVQRVNLAIFKKYEKAATNVSQMPADFKEGDRVRTEHGLGTVTAHTPLHNAANSVCVKLDKFTYNYGWKGLPHLLIDCHCSNITRTDEGRNADFSDEDCKKEIIEAAQMGVVRCCARNGKEIRIRAAYDNDSGNPEHWTYCVTWYQGKAVRNCENGVTLDQAAHHFSHFKDEFTKQAEGKCVYKIGERVTRNGTGAAGTIDDYGIHDGRLTYIVKYDETQHLKDGSEYLNEEVFAEEIKS